MIDVHAHAEALVDALEARGLRVYLGGAGYKADDSYEKPVTPYSVVYMDGGSREGASLIDDQEEQSGFDTTVWSVGTSLRSCNAIRSEVLALAGAMLPVNGRLCRVRVLPGGGQPSIDRDDPRVPLFQARDLIVVDSLQA